MHTILKKKNLNVQIFEVVINIIDNLNVILLLISIDNTILVCEHIKHTNAT